MLKNEIIDSFRILDYPESWDDEGAKRIEEKHLFKALELLLHLANNTESLEEPEINPCNNGSIDLSWRHSKTKYRLLINVKDKVAWFGDNGFGQDEIKDSQEHWNSSLVEWVKRNMCVSG